MIRQRRSCNFRPPCHQLDLGKASSFKVVPQKRRGILGHRQRTSALGRSSGRFLSF